MAVQPADLLAPAGPLEPALFPGEGDGSPGSDLDTRLSAYINQANAKIVSDAVPFADPDHAVTLWALHLAFHAAHMVAIARPATANSLVPVLGSDTFSKDQRDFLNGESLKYGDAYNALAASSTTGTTPPRDIGSRSTPITYAW